MKKVFAIVLAVVLMMALSLSVMALPSSQGSEVSKVVVNHTDTGSNVTTVVSVDEQGSITLDPGKSKTLEFKGWVFYVSTDADEIASLGDDYVPADDEVKLPESGKVRRAIPGIDYTIDQVLLEDGSNAVEGVDYDIVDGKIVPRNNNRLTLVVSPIAETLYASDLFGEVKVNFVVPSPTTGFDANGVIWALALLSVCAGAAVVFTKKSVLDR